MREWTPEQIAHAARANLLDGPAGRPGSRPRHGPERVSIDSRDAGPGTLFVGLPGASVDGGAFAGEALAAGAWGTLTTPAHARAAQAAGAAGVTLAAEDPLEALQRLANAWRRRLEATVIGVTGSAGKTSTKELLLALLAPHRRTVASRANFNTEIGLPLEILAAPAETEILVLEMAMRGAGQIAELAAIAEPEVGVIVNIGPVHLELLGTVEAIAAAKAELIAALPAPGGRAVIPVNEPLLDPHRRPELTTTTFGPGGDVALARVEGERVWIDHLGRTIALEVPFTQAHLRANLLAAVAAAMAVGVTPSGRVEVQLAAGRGGRRVLKDEVTLIDDCYNANPLSVHAALSDLAQSANGGRRVAILGDMLELGARERSFHAEVGRRANELGVDLLVTVGPLAAVMADTFAGEVHATADAREAAELAGRLLRPGDTVLVKGSRGVGLELVCDTLAAEHAAAG